MQTAALPLLEVGLRYELALTSTGRSEGLEPREGAYGLDTGWELRSGELGQASPH